MAASRTESCLTRLTIFSLPVTQRRSRRSIPRRWKRRWDFSPRIIPKPEGAKRKNLWTRVSWTNWKRPDSSNRSGRDPEDQTWSSNKSYSEERSGRAIEENHFDDGISTHSITGLSGSGGGSWRRLRFRSTRYQRSGIHWHDRGSGKSPLYSRAPRDVRCLYGRWLRASHGTAKSGAVEHASWHSQLRGRALRCLPRPISRRADLYQRRHTDRRPRFAHRGQRSGRAHEAVHEMELRGSSRGPHSGNIESGVQSCFDSAYWSGLSLSPQQSSRRVHQRAES